MCKFLGHPACYRESQRRRVQRWRVMFDVNRWTHADFTSSVDFNDLTLLQLMVVETDDKCSSWWLHGVIWLQTSSWTLLSSSPTVSNCISWRVSHDVVTRRRVDVTDSDRNANVSDGDFYHITSHHIRLLVQQSTKRNFVMSAPACSFNGPRLSFQVAYPAVWNSLPTRLRSASISHRQVMDGLKIRLFAQAFTWFL